MSDSTADFLRTTRAAYDAIAKDYAARFPAGGIHPLDRALISGFAELVTANGSAPRRRPGQRPRARHRAPARAGVPVFGVDLSPRW